ncbi:hypothetical protein TNCV_2526341 [Trichonephila clavipes]|nr:hypothetical protein TNCV_2526341 [Trichonephila clavipes]
MARRKERRVPGFVNVFTKTVKPLGEKEKITRKPRTHLKGAFSLVPFVCLWRPPRCPGSNDGLACLDLWCVSLLTLSPHSCRSLIVRFFPPTILFHTTLGSRLYMRVLARALSPSSIFIMPKKINSFSQTPSSTPRRHSCGSPIAHRLRSRIATEQAVQQSILSRLNACEITLTTVSAALPTGGTYQHSKYVPTPSQHQASPFLSTPSTQEKIQRESSTPKAVTPPRQTSAPPSPSVLDIVLRGDISLPPSPESQNSRPRGNQSSLAPHRFRPSRHPLSPQVLGEILL